MSSKSKSSSKRAASPPPADKGNTAKKQICSIFNEPAPPAVRHIRANRGGDATSTALCKVQGVVTRTKDETVNGPTGPIMKKRIDLVVTGVISNGAQDIVRSGVNGEVYLFPSQVVDTPETAEANKKDGGFKSKARELLISPYQSVRKLSTFSASFYRDSKDGGASPVMQCEPGSLVEISGVCVNAVTKNGATNFYLNGGKITLLSDKAPSPGKLPRFMISLCKQPDVQEWSAFTGSIAMRGFFDEDQFSFMSPPQQTQALACQAVWTRLVTSVADRLAIMAQGKDENVAAQLNAYEQRIRAMPPAKLAAGDMALFPVDQYDTTLFPVVQNGMSPSDNVPEFMKLLQGTPEEQAKLPSTFTAPWVVNVACHGNAINVDLRIAYIFNTMAAIEAFDKGDEGSPVLATSSAGAAMTLSMRDFAVKFGSLYKEKVTMACDALLYTGDKAVFVKMSHVEDGGAAAIKTEFPEGGTMYLDMAASLNRHAILVSESFIKTNLCGGGSQFVPPKAGKDVEKLDFPQGVTEMPDLEEYNYQEITGDAFDIDNWASLSGGVEYRVVCPDVRTTLASKPELASDSAKGENFLKELGHGTPAAMKTFLTGSCLVYARRV